MRKFSSRESAGEALANLIVRATIGKPVVLAIPNGGIPIALKVSNLIGANTYICPVVKVKWQANLHIGIGALSSDKAIMVNKETLSKLEISPSETIDAINLAQNDLNAKIKIFSEYTDLEKVKDNTAIIVDDGISSGYTIRSAIKNVRRFNPLKIVVATPVVSSIYALPCLSDLGIEIIYLKKDNSVFCFIDQHYVQFPNIDNNLAKRILTENRPKSLA
ncbi:MAG TPA: phosphoribosyltransferase family protein [Oligoflexia bacterium]|nr:phosphoribosyltransferase family protein [Oligoflexia bacterium]HMP49131.1 phosphoribosyltransferase family protein [Oligoflexia bacterium]